MSDRFDHTFDRKFDTKADAAGEASTPARRIELITGTARRWDWSDDDKARIIVESLAPDANISAVARRHGIKPQQLFGWRREARELFRDCLDPAASTGASPVPPATATKARLSENATTFAEVVKAPAVTTPASLAPPPALPPAGTSQGIEIDLARDELQALLDAPDASTVSGIRDRAMLHLAFAAGMRVSELVGLRLDQIDRPPRACLAAVEGDGFEYILAKHVTTASHSANSISAKRVSPHVLRHNCAMHTLQATRTPVARTGAW